MSPISHRIRVPDHVAELIRNMHPNIKRKIRASLEILLKDPSCGNTLRNELSGLMSFRVSRHRIVYRINRQRTVEFVSLGPRKSIYEETYRLLKKEGKEEL